MDTDQACTVTLTFLDFELTLARRQLLRNGQPVAIGGRALELLALLAARSGEVVCSRMLIDRIWPNMVVEQVNLRVQIAALRKLLRDDAQHAYIVNHAGRGYCFTAAVTPLPAATRHAVHGAPYASAVRPIPA